MMAKAEKRAQQSDVQGARGLSDPDAVAAKNTNGDARASKVKWYKIQHEDLFLTLA
jgi:hypothetical protein